MSMQIKLLLEGVPPPKKNAKKLIRVHGRTLIVPSDRYENWHEITYYQILKQMRGYNFQRLPLQKVQKVCISYFPKDKRKRDLTNMTDSIMDMLVDVNLLADDSIFVVPRLELEYGGILRTEGKTEICIFE